MKYYAENKERNEKMKEMKNILNKVIEEMKYVKNRRELYNPSNFVLMPFIIIVLFIMLIITLFIDSDVMKVLLELSTIFLIFWLLGIIFEVIIRTIILSDNDIKQYFLCIVGSIGFSLIIFFFDAFVFDEILTNEFHLQLFLGYLVIRHYVAIYSTRKLIKVSKKEFYRHIAKLYSYFVILTIPFLSIGGYNLKFYHNKSTSYSFAEVINEGIYILKGEHSHDDNQKIIFWTFGIAGIFVAKDLVGNCNNRIYFSKKRIK